MYTLSKQKIGRWLALHLWDEEVRTGLSILPERGGCLLSLTFKGTQVLDGYTEEAELMQLDWAKNVLLYPFPNRLKNGTYQVDHRSYTFPINDKKTGNALHGFGMWSELEVLSTEEEAAAGVVVLGYQDEGQRMYYPFPFQFTMRLAFETATRLEVTLSFTNTGDQEMPLGFGWHPYFKLGPTAAEHWLQLPSCKRVELDEFSIPTGTLLEANGLQVLHQVKDQSWDDCFAVEITGERIETRLKGPEADLIFWQETGQGKFNFIQVFTPPHRQSVAIEPMTCNVDAFNNQEGLIRLAPGQETSARFGIQSL